ncbi:MAG: outer membrane lipoprotein-sorting protein [Myxococcales bacterium]|nr:outer membrane lipoprotein-sorting protein [Myxococcales bacterium]
MQVRFWLGQPGWLLPCLAVGLLVVLCGWVSTPAVGAEEAESIRTPPTGQLGSSGLRDVGPGPGSKSQAPAPAAAVESVDPSENDLDVAAPSGALSQGPSADEVEDAIPEGGTLTGKELYSRFLKNKLHSAVQHQRSISRDPGGNEQETRFWVRWRDYRDENDEPVDDVINKTLVKFKEPFDMKGTAYLMVVRADRASEQWVYRPSDRRVRRVKMRGGAGVGGTDFSWDDIAFQNVEDADYERLPDEVVRGVDVYVVLAKLKPLKRSRYSKSMVYLEKDHYIALKARHWDHARVEVKELNSEYDSIKRFGDHWVATRGVAQNLQEGTSSSMLIEGLDPDVEIADAMFRTFRLESTRERLTKKIRGVKE